MRSNRHPNGPANTRPSTPEFVPSRSSQFVTGDKKPATAKRPEAFGRVGLLFDGPPASVGCPAISHPMTSN
jgi:hypothetical protein